MSRGLRAYGDRMGAISSNVASNVGNLRMRAADSRARGIEGRGRTFQNLAQGLSGMVGQELQARPQRRMAAEDRRMNQQEQMMRMDQAGQGLVRGDQQIAMNDQQFDMNEQKMRAMQQQKRELLAVQEIRSQFPEDPTAAAAELIRRGHHAAGQKILDTQIAFETAKRDLGDKEIKASEQATKMLADDLDASQVSDEDLPEWYSSTARRLKGSPLYEEFGSLIDQYFSNPPDDPGLRDFLNQAHRDVADSTYFLKQNISKADLAAKQLNNAKDGMLYVAKKFAATATGKGWKAAYKRLEKNMQPDIWEQIKADIPEEASKEARAYFKDMAKPEGATPASIQEYNFYKAQVEAGEKAMSYIEFRQLMRKPADQDNLSVSQALSVISSIEGEAKSRMDDLNGDLAEMTFPEAVKVVAKGRKVSDMQDLYAYSMGQKPGAEPEAAVETRTGPGGKVYERGADGLWLEKK